MAFCMAYVAQPLSEEFFPISHAGPRGASTKMYALYAVAQPGNFTLDSFLRPWHTCANTMARRNVAEARAFPEKDLGLDSRELDVLGGANEDEDEGDRETEMLPPEPSIKVSSMRRSNAVERVSGEHADTLPSPGVRDEPFPLIRQKRESDHRVTTPGSTGSSAEAAHIATLRATMSEGRERSRKVVDEFKSHLREAQSVSQYPEMFREKMRELVEELEGHYKLTRMPIEERNQLHLAIYDMPKNWEHASQLLIEALEQMGVHNVSASPPVLMGALRDANKVVLAKALRRVVAASAEPVTERLPHPPVHVDDSSNSGKPPKSAWRRFLSFFDLS